MSGTILMMGSFADPAAMELQYESGLKKLGWEVLRFEVAQNFGERISQSVITKIVNRLQPNLLTRQINEDAIAAAKNSRPDVVLIFKGMALRPDALTEMRTHTRLMANYNPDHPLRIYSVGATNKNVIKSIGRYDVFFSYAKAITKKIKDLNGPAAYTIPFGYINNLPANNEAPVENVSHEPFAFVGSWDREREELFNRLNRTDVAIYGTGAWATNSKPGSLVHRLYQKKGLYNLELIRCFQSATGILNFLRPQNMDEASHNMRTFEVPGVGGLLLSPFTQEQADYFEPDKEAVYYTTLDELREKMSYLSQHPETVRSIKAQARKRSVESGYAYDDRAKELSDILKKHLR